jgi:GntR family transcriptional regulator
MDRAARRGEQARYLEVSDALRRQIQELAPNSLLPTEHQLAKRFAVSRITVSRALSLLERSGLVSRRRGQGTVTSPAKITRRFYPVYTFEQDLRLQGIKFETRVVECDPAVTPPPGVREHLRLSPRDAVGLVSLVRLIEDRIVCHDRRYVPSLLARRFNQLLIENRSVSGVFAELAGEGPIATVDWECEILPSPSDIAGVLGITPGSLIVQSRFTLYLENGTPLETGFMCYRIDRFKFQLLGRFADPRF